MPSNQTTASWIRLHPGLGCPVSLIFLPVRATSCRRRWPSTMATFMWETLTLFRLFRALPRSSRSHQPARQLLSVVISPLFSALLSLPQRGRTTARSDSASAARTQGAASSSPVSSHPLARVLCRRSFLHWHEFQEHTGGIVKNRIRYGLTARAIKFDARQGGH